MLERETLLQEMFREGSGVDNEEWFWGYVILLVLSRQVSIFGCCTVKLGFVISSRHLVDVIRYRLG